MSAAFIPTAKVRHLAVFSQPARNFYAWTPLCGARNAPAGDLVWPGDINPALLAAVYRRRYAAAMRRPVCKRCTATLTALNNLTRRTA